MGSFPEFVENRVLLPESFIRVRLSQICTFGVPLEHGISSLLSIKLYIHCMSEGNESQEDKYHLIWKMP